MFSSLTALALALGAVFAPVHAAPVAQPQPVERESVSVSVSVSSNDLWLAETLDTAGIVLPSNVVVIFTDTDNCGSAISPDGQGGGCTRRFSDGTISVLVSQFAVDNGSGEHILFHELGHALHNLGECAAEYYSHHYSNPNLWSYTECIQ